jgi:predicted DCC family thiol-disulfide oxidoreductase YuxK
MTDKPIVVYDNKCLFCINYKNKVDKLDKAKKLKWVAIDNFDYKKYNLKKENLLEEMHIIFNDKVYKGYYAWKQIFKKIPLMYPMYLISLIPGVDLIWDKLYKLVSKHRYQIK